MNRTKRFPFIAVIALLLMIAADHSELIAAQTNSPPVIVVEASYPGANAAVVRDTIAAPIEEQVNGVKDMLHLVSRSSNDGAYSLLVTFKPGTDLNIAQVLVQNRVALALPVLPALVQNAGVTVKKESPQALMLVDLTSPKNRFDTAYLRKYADSNVRDTLGRLPGVGGVTSFGNSGAGEQGHASFNGKPAVCLEIRPMAGANPKELSAAVQDAVAKLRQNLPDGVAINVDFDFSENLEAPGQPSTPEYLLLDIQLPSSASQERIIRVQQSCGKLLSGIDEVRDVLELPDEPFELGVNRPCNLVRLAPASGRKASREQLVQTIRDQLATEIPGALLRLRDLSRPGSFPRCAYPIDLALTGPEPDALQKWADSLAERLRKEKKLIDIAIDADAVAVPWLFVDVDRAQCSSLGVSMNDVFSTLQIYLGSRNLGEVGRLGQIRLQADAHARENAADLKQLKVRSANGDMIALDRIAKIRDVAGPAAIKRLDMRQIVEITANPAPGVSLGESRALCEKLAEEIRPETKVPAEYRLHWMQDIPTGE